MTPRSGHTAETDHSGLAHMRRRTEELEGRFTISARAESRADRVCRAASGWLRAARRAWTTGWLRYKQKRDRRPEVMECYHFSPVWPRESFPVGEVQRRLS